jgi:2-polyprenyl-3-methyl-5-hydroxy-6-metoxy-1,4-benzoquinol methylase
MTGDILTQQIDYYRRRAPEYDRTAYPDLTASTARIDRVVAALAPRGRILELACGTGMWTRALAAHSTDVTALDASTEPIEVARTRCPAHVRFGVADVFDWQPSDTYDVVFFGFWLSHVPTARLDAFFETVTSAVAPGGRLLFVDEHDAYPNKEEWSDQPEVAIREMTDGTRHPMVKVFLDPDDLCERLSRLGWAVSFEVDRAWLIASAHRV